MGIDETVEGGDQAAALAAAVIFVGAHADHFETFPVMAFNQLHDLGRDRMMRDIRRNIGQPDLAMLVSRGGQWRRQCRKARGDDIGGALALQHLVRAVAQQGPWRNRFFRHDTLFHLGADFGAAFPVAEVEGRDRRAGKGFRLAGEGQVKRGQRLIVTLELLQRIAPVVQHLGIAGLSASA